MKCICGGPMRQIVVTLDDIWWTCVICGRAKQAHIDEPLPLPPQTPVKQQQHWAAAVAVISVKPGAGRGINMADNNKTLSDLNEKLHDQLSRLCKPDLSGENLKAEIERTRAVSGLAREIVENAKLVLEAQRCLGGKEKTPKMLGVSE